MVQAACPLVQLWPWSVIDYYRNTNNCSMLWNLRLDIFLCCQYAKMKHIKNIKVVLPDALNDIIIPSKTEISKDHSYLNRHENYGESLGKSHDDCYLPLPINQRKMDVQLGNLEDSASLGSMEEHIDNDEIANVIDLLYLSDDSKSENHLEIGNIVLQPQTSPVNNTMDIKPSINEDGVTKFTSTGYIPVPVANPSSSGYVQVPSSKFLSADYTQPQRISGNSVANYHKTSEIAYTDAKNISGYVTHKQLSDYGHNNQ